MLNVIFYSPTKDEELEWKTYDVDGNEVVIKETTAVNRPISFACDTMVNGDSFFAYDSRIQLFNGQMPSLVTANSMFECTNITTVHFNNDMANFNSVKNGASMFAECSKLKSVKIELNTLVNGEKMFYKSPITTLECPSFESVLYGQYMFSQTELTSFSHNLNSLIDGSFIFADCSLTSFNGKLSNVQNLNRAFSNNTDLTSFETDSLRKLESAEGAFYNTKLEKWIYDISSLRDGDNMFYGNATLTSFTSSLSSLEKGDKMFYGCKLDEQSLMNIVDSLPKHDDGEEHKITIGINCNNNQSEKDAFAAQAEYDDWNTLNSVLVSKGWTVTWGFNK